MSSITPHRHEHPERRDHTRSRSRSPTRTRTRTRQRSKERSRHHRHHRHNRHHNRHHDRHDRTREQVPESIPEPIILPYNARPLSRRDLPTHEPMFAMYLDIQKGLILEDLTETEAKGRWKSFVQKWNRGELAEGWYDPSTLVKAQDGDSGVRRGSNTREEGNGGREGYEDEDEDEDEEEEEYGPVLPKHRSGPTIPSIQDLELRNESITEDLTAARSTSHQQHRAEMRSHRSELKHLEDEVAPRAEPGTHERRMEKRREAAASNRAFAEARRGDSPEGAREDDLMGSGEGDLDAIKKAREKEQRKKNEREIRREEILRARAAERAERLQQYRAKEEETIGWLKTLARQRFG